MQLKLPNALAKGQPGILHQYAERLVAFEFTRGNQRKPHSLIFIGGLSDGLWTVDYMTDLVAALQHSEWSVFSLVLSSSYNGWGVGRLGKDIDEIAQCVQYVRDYKKQLFGAGKVVIMGHSTGSQDVMHYLSCPNPRPRHPVLDREIDPLTRTPVDGAIMQAPVSDRESILSVLNDGTERDSPEVMQELYRKAVADAKENTYEDDDTVETVVPLSVTARIGYPSSTAVSSRRFLSLASPDSPRKPDEDDLFSSDLSDEQLQQTFGVIGSRGLLKSKFMVLYSGRDQSVPPWVNKEALLKRWSTAAGPSWHPKSMIIPNASHALSDPDQAEPRRILAERVITYLDEVTKQA
ncbi:Protein of unknown function DUF1749 [Aspergillus parasiticus SU-1]|uniref:Esterase n=1 Tax=Aspergillus parasiticus (strain ATCC 56775 / NRRL 5862 / SRRC 143 / SU-1) TaxID=1403190 RepID=A0A0F0I9I4_ASPPU|nr:Protein of unknown function DUF1749 [Aspergillus parasiticus SU-1]